MLMRMTRSSRAQRPQLGLWSTSPWTRMSKRSCLMGVTHPRQGVRGHLRQSHCRMRVRGHLHQSRCRMRVRWLQSRCRMQWLRVRQGGQSRSCLEAWMQHTRLHVEEQRRNLVTLLVATRILLQDDRGARQAQGGQGEIAEATLFAFEHIACMGLSLQDLS